MLCLVKDVTKDVQQLEETLRYDAVFKRPSKDGSQFPAECWPVFVTQMKMDENVREPSMQTCPEMWLCYWSFHNPWETHCHLGSSCHTFANWTPRRDPGSVRILTLLMFYSRQRSTRNSHEILRTLCWCCLWGLFRGFPQSPPFPASETGENIFKFSFSSKKCSTCSVLLRSWKRSKAMQTNSHPPGLQCWKTQPSCWVGSGMSQNGGKPSSPEDVSVR